MACSAASGAALGGVVCDLFFGFGLGVQVGAFVGAALALVAVLAIHRSDGLSPILTLVLAGVVVSAFCGALVGLVTYVADPETKLPGIVFWLLGSFAAANWTKLALISLCTLVAGIVMLGMRWRVNVLSLGDEDARSLGINPARDRLILITATCLLPFQLKSPSVARSAGSVSSFLIWRACLSGPIIAGCCR